MNLFLHKLGQLLLDIAFSPNHAYRLCSRKWNQVPTLQEQFATNGWSHYFGWNIYLSSTFGLADNWGEHRCINWPLVDVQIEKII